MNSPVHEAGRHSYLIGYVMAVQSVLLEIYNSDLHIKEEQGAFMRLAITYVMMKQARHTRIARSEEYRG